MPAYVSTRSLGKALLAAVTVLRKTGGLQSVPRKPTWGESTRTMQLGLAAPAAIC